MWLKTFIFCKILLINFVVAGDVGDDCVPNESTTDGVCAVITDCEVAVSEIKSKNFHSYQRCGFSGALEIVCCPRTANKFGSSTEQPVTSKIKTKPKILRIADRECQKIINSSIPPLTQHIIGGEITTPGEFPHMVALGFERDTGYKFDCGGSLLSNIYVLTAAHCVDTLERIEPSIVRMGVAEIGNSRWNPASDLRIAEIIRHPKYTRREKYHDLALLRLEKRVEFSSELNAACLYTDEEDPHVPLTITGWGTTSTTKDARSNVLLKANVTVVSRSKCSESYGNWRKLPREITEEQLCAGDPEGLRDTCQGDSGGPLQGLTANDGYYRLVGITSFGRGCGSPIPGVYTRIFHYLDWIEGIVWKN